MSDFRKLRNSQLDRLNVADFKAANKTPIIVVLDDIRSLNNVGSVFRTSDAFRIEKIYLCGITATPPHKDIQKTALGATDSVDWEYRENCAELIEQLSQEDINSYAIEQTENATMLNDFAPEKTPMAIVFGNEVKGVQQKVIDRCAGVIEIPQIGTKHSLNISVSTGVVLWDLFQKLLLKV
ncbi:RNA methyltransferase [Gilvibacter sp.]|uniref:RNA methyltransferase n=1 Tax=Gilvibacter sp. TaxID=2729997 RepID=UPI0025C59DE3|nr:RNA methyltransferase [Gilvibacter sp.]NQX76311.1 RNA methyltransferase [Gilvibacter sp.]